MILFINFNIDIANAGFLAMREICQNTVQGKTRILTYFKQCWFVVPPEISCPVTEAAFEKYS